MSGFYSESLNHNSLHLQIILSYKYFTHVLRFTKNKEKIEGIITSFKILTNYYKDIISYALNNKKNHVKPYICKYYPQLTSDIFFSFKNFNRAMISFLNSPCA